MPELHVVAGPNGAGKTTCFKQLVPEGIDYINADLIVKTLRERAGGLNVQDIANREAADLFWSKVAQNQSFAIETNLHDVETYKSFQVLQAKGYKVIVYFVSVENVETCIERVKSRVKVGGHNVNPDVIRERYVRGLALLKHFKNFPDVLILLDNTTELMMSVVLYKGVGAKFSHSNWVESVLTDPPKRESFEGKSIEEILRIYKGKKDQ
jgi:predicted ABC-type ATPase